MMGESEGHGKDKKWESLLELTECSFAISTNYTREDDAQAGFIHLSLDLTSCFIAFGKVIFFLTLNPWRSGWGSLPWEHLLEAFMPIFLHLKPSWNHWRVLVRLPLNSSPSKGMYRSFGKAVSFSKVLSHISYNGHLSWMTMEKE